MLSEYVCVCVCVCTESVFTGHVCKTAYVNTTNPSELASRDLLVLIHSFMLLYLRFIHTLQREHIFLLMHQL